MVTLDGVTVKRLNRGTLRDLRKVSPKGVPIVAVWKDPEKPRRRPEIHLLVFGDYLIRLKSVKEVEDLQGMLAKFSSIAWPGRQRAALGGRLDRFLDALEQRKGNWYPMAHLPGAVHEHGCPATKIGKRCGPCLCGAETMEIEVLESLRELCKISDKDRSALEDRILKQLVREEAPRVGPST